jgi:hypothetical protein
MMNSKPDLIELLSKLSIGVQFCRLTENRLKRVLLSSALQWLRRNETAHRPPHNRESSRTRHRWADSTKVAAACQSKDIRQWIVDLAGPTKPDNVANLSQGS